MEKLVKDFDEVENIVQGINEQFLLLKQNAETMIDFNESNHSIITKTIDQAKKMIQLQLFSSSMNENLINDLMDMAKLENNKFKIHKEYFNLVEIIEQSFSVVFHSS